MLVARPAPDLILVRHESAPALGMAAMDLMAVSVAAGQVEGAGVRTGDTVRLAVRPEGDRLRLLRIEKLP